MSDAIPVVALSGDAAARGLRHGEALAKPIERCIEIYAALFELPQARIREAAAAFEATVRPYSPELATEIDAIADGAGQPRAWLWALNARSEIVSAAPPECTAAFFPTAGLIGQTWDWLEPLAELVTVLDVERRDGHRLLTVTEPGIVGKIGLNSAGIGVCLNFLRSPQALTGVPVHVLLREVLETANLAKARRRIDAAGAGRSGHLLVGSAHDGGFGFEFTGRDRHELAPEQGALIHTNHCLQGDVDPGPGGPNSRARLDAARQAACADPVRDWQALAALLSHCDEPDPISVSWRQTPTWRFARLGTICAVAMDLPARRLHVRKGPDPAVPWRAIDLNAQALAARPMP